MHAPDTFPDLSIEFGPSGLVLIEQDDNSGNIDRISLHPVQVEHIAVRLGLMHPGASNALLQVATLRRRMQTLMHRIDRLTDMLSLCGEHENLQSEQDYAMATWEIATEFCADFDQAFGKALPKGTNHGAETQPATAPETPVKKPAPGKAQTAQLNFEEIT